MCAEKFPGGGPVNKPRHWRELERRREKEMKVLNWHTSQKNQISAPLILNPTAGFMTREIKKGYANFKKVTGMRVCVQERAEMSNKSLAMSEPLR